MKMQTLTFCLIAFCCVSLAYGLSLGGRSSGSGAKISVSVSRPVVRPPPSRPVVVVRPQPPRPVVVVKPPSRPVVVVVTKPRPPVVIIRRRTTYHPIIYPIYHPVPVYTVVITTNRQQQVSIPSQAECTKAGKSIFEYCQSQVNRNYAPSTLNSTFRTCCSTYAESSCYIDNAGQYCSPSAASALIKHSQDVANYFGGSICQAIQFTSWDSTCASNEADVAKKYYSSAASTKPAFIALPSSSGSEKTCLDKLRSRAQPEGDLVQRCTTASLDAWDPDRSKIVNSQVYESCCAMYDALECIQTQASGICSDSEIADLSSYKTISTSAFSQGVCRAVPYANFKRVCHGDLSSPTGGSAAVLPSIILSLVATLALLFVQ